MRPALPAALVAALIAPLTLPLISAVGCGRMLTPQLASQARPSRLERTIARGGQVSSPSE